MKVLTLPLNGVYFDQIAAGEKLEEFRLRTDFWHRRIVGRSYDRVILTRGYPKGGGVEGVTRLTREWRGYRMCALTHPHFGPEPVSVFAIDVSTPSPTLSADIDGDEENICRVCSKPIAAAEMCADCARSNDPFVTSKYSECR